MGYIAAILFIFIGVLFQKKDKTWTAPEVLFCYVWGIVSFFAALRLFDLSEVSFKAWFIIVVGTISFVLGARFKSSIGKQSFDHMLYSGKTYLPKKMFWILFWIMFILVAKELMETIGLMKMGYSLGLIRNASYGDAEIKGYIRNTGYISVWLDVLRSAIQVIIIACGIEYFIIDIKKNKIYLLAVSFLVIADAFTTGGRWGIAYFIIELFVCYKIYWNRGIYGDKTIISPKAKRRIMLVLISLVTLILVVSIVRGVSIEDSVSYFYAYLCGCVPLLDIKLGEISSSGIWSIIFAGQYGLLTLLVPIFFKGLLGTDMPNIYEVTLSDVMTGQSYYDIGGGRRYNAFVTTFYYLYADMRWIGVVIGMFIFGQLMGILYRSTFNNQNKCTVVPYLIFTQMIIKSIQVYPFSSQVYVAVFLLMICIHISRNVKIRNF